METHIRERTVQINAESDVFLEGDLRVPDGAPGIVLFAHGSGSTRHSPRNQFVARTLNQAGLATLLIDLLTPVEAQADEQTRQLRFDIDLLAGRLVSAILWLTTQNDTRPLNIGLFGASTGAGAALVAASRLTSLVSAVVSRGGRPDLAGAALAHVQAPTLLIVGGNDPTVIGLNRRAAQQLRVSYSLEIIPGATHLFEEPGTLDQVARLARDWFLHYLVETA